MKKILSLAAMLALTFTLSAVNAQEQPKAAKKEKSGCCVTGSSKAKQMGECSGEMATSKKMAAKHDCTDKCGDDCKTAHNVSKTESDKKN